MGCPETRKAPNSHPVLPLISPTELPRGKFRSQSTQCNPNQFRARVQKFEVGRLLNADRFGLRRTIVPSNERLFAELSNFIGLLNSLFSSPALLPLPTSVLLTYFFSPLCTGRWQPIVGSMMLFHWAASSAPPPPVHACVRLL